METMCWVRHKQQLGVNDFMTKRFPEMEKDSRIHGLEVESECEDLKREIKAKVPYEDETLASQRQQLLAQEQHGRRLHQYQVAYQTICEEIAIATEQCNDEQAFVAKVSAHTRKLNILKEAINQLITRCKPASGIMQRLQEVLRVMHEESQKINEQLHQRAAKQVHKTQATGSSQFTKALTCRIMEGESNDICERESFHLYMSLQQHLKNVEDFYKNFKEDDSLKNLRFECQKQVNICVNALCAQTADRLKDNLLRMSGLIAGQHMEFGHGQVLASSHPEAIAFCRNLLAKKFVCQGAISNPKLMFAYGAVIEALWADFPDFGQLIFANFHRECPYLVPIFMPHLEGQSTEDYKKSLGYHYNKRGEVETQEEFQSRMTGIIRLYAAVLISDPCRHQQNESHPHGLSQAWRWMSCMLNMDPKTDICATLIYDFLQVAGSAMYSHYGQQFQKLLHLISKEYLPKIEKITPTGAAMLRLGCFVQRILKQGHIPPPVGLLPPDFW